MVKGYAGASAQLYIGLHTRMILTYMAGAWVGKGMVKTWGWRRRVGAY